MISAFSGCCRASLVKFRTRRINSSDDITKTLPRLLSGGIAPAVFSWTSSPQLPPDCEYKTLTLFSALSEAMLEENDAAPETAPYEPSIDARSSCRVWRVFE